MTLSKAHQFFFLRRNSNISTKASNLLLQKQLRLRFRTIPDIRQHFARGISLTLRKKGATAQAEHQALHHHSETYYRSRSPLRNLLPFQITIPPNRAQLCHHVALARAEARPEAEVAAAGASPPTPGPQTSLRLRTEPPLSRRTWWPQQQELSSSKPSSLPRTLQPQLQQTRTGWLLSWKHSLNV